MTNVKHAIVQIFRILLILLYLFTKRAASLSTFYRLNLEKPKHERITNYMNLGATLGILSVPLLMPISASFLTK